MNCQNGRRKRKFLSDSTTTQETALRFDIYFVSHSFLGAPASRVAPPHASPALGGSNILPAQISAHSFVNLKFRQAFPGSLAVYALPTSPNPTAM